MRNHKEMHVFPTPTRKWMQLNSQESGLVFVESEESDCEVQLFHSLIASASSINEQVSNESASQSSLIEDSFVEPSSLSSSSPKQVPSEFFSEVMKLKQFSSKKQERKVVIGRKGCNCRSSKCQKSYCDCFRMGLTCAEGVCSCKDCHNMNETWLHRQINRKLFYDEMMMQRGCHCKKSKCMKKYCQCHSGGRKCGIHCQCIGCFNQDENHLPGQDSLKKFRKTAEEFDCDATTPIR